MWSAWEWECTRCVTLDGLPLARVTLEDGIRRCPGADWTSTSTTPSRMDVGHGSLPARGADGDRRCQEG